MDFLLLFTCILLVLLNYTAVSSYSNKILIPEDDEDCFNETCGVTFNPYSPLIKCSYLWVDVIHSGLGALGSRLAQSLSLAGLRLCLVLFSTVFPLVAMFLTCVVRLFLHIRGCKKISWWSSAPDPEKRHRPIFFLICYFSKKVKNVFISDSQLVHCSQILNLAFMLLF